MIQTGQFRSRQNFWAQPAPQNRDANSIVLRDECARIAHRSGSCPASAFGWRLGTSQELGCAALTRIGLSTAQYFDSFSVSVTDTVPAVCGGAPDLMSGALTPRRASLSSLIKVSRSIAPPASTRAQCFRRDGQLGSLEMNPPSRVRD